VLINHDEKWADNCHVPWIEVYAAAQAIMDECQSGADHAVNGYHKLRLQSGCGSTVEIRKL
jgi:hypothetical protein